jgi:hypothetical protein
VSLALKSGVMSLAVLNGTAIFALKDYFNVNRLVVLTMLAFLGPAQAAKDVQ